MNELLENNIKEFDQSDLLRNIRKNIENDPTRFKGTVKEFFEESAKIIEDSK